METIAQANLWLRTASRVIVRVASFRAQAFHELERLARAVPWERFVAAGGTVRFRVTSKKSRLYHTDAIAQRFAEAIEHRLGKASAIDTTGTEVGEGEGEGEREGDEMTPRAQLFVIRVVHDQFTVSADSSGALLHRRGYRKAIAKAPVRETLAAAMLMASDWTGSVPLVDPLCGSGTIPIEAALLARRMAPGLRRTFAFLQWPDVDSALWARVRADAAGKALPRALVQIRGSDRDAGAIESARANAERAGVLGDIEFTVAPLSTLDGTGNSERIGYVVTNPPYGVRVGQAAKLRDLYARFGQALRTNSPRWRLAILSANPRLDAELRLPLKERLKTQNGGIPVRLLTAEVPAGSNDPAGE